MILPLARLAGLIGICLAGLSTGCALLPGGEPKAADAAIASINSDLFTTVPFVKFRPNAFLTSSLPCGGGDFGGEQANAKLAKVGVLLPNRSRFS